MCSTFRLADEADGYRLTVGGYSGYTADGMFLHNGFMFNTADRDNGDHPQVNCALLKSGGWRYRGCYQSCLNGLYYSEPTAPKSGGITWDDNGWHVTLYP